VDNETETVAGILNSATQHISLRWPISTMAEEQYDQLRMQMAQTTLTTDQDRARWNWTENGEFTVKSAYEAVKKVPHISNNLHRIWKTKVPPRFKVFAWIMIQNKILTIDNLKKKGMILVNKCVMCKRENETVKHLFSRCE
jgi:hypothetical protein